MDRRLRRELDSIARDTHSGAAELALRAVKALQDWLRQYRRLGEIELLEAAQALWKAQPSMAPFLRLANQAALAADAPDPRRVFSRSLQVFENLLQTAPRRIARLFAQALRPEIGSVATYSYSSTVLHALKHARSRLERVICSESRPGNEGRETARRLAEAGVEVVFMTDAALLGEVARADLFVCGADAVEHFGFVNKTGTEPLVLRARRGHTPVWLLADTSKFLPKAAVNSLWKLRTRPGREVWPQAPQAVRVLNPYFEPVEFFPDLRLLTEKGWMRPAQVRQELKKIRVSPHLRALAG